jgi:hypothetical protein
MVGGQYFRIARDGSRITDAAPPPYGFDHRTNGGTTPNTSLRAPSPSISGTSETSSISSSALRGAHYFIGSDDESDTDAGDEGTVTPRQHSPVRRPDSALRANILDPSQLDMPSPVGSDDARPSTAIQVDESEPPARNPSYKEGPEILSVAPEARRLRRTESQTGLRNVPEPRMTSPLRRRNGVRLPSLDTQMLSFGVSATNQRHKATEGKSQSAGPVLYNTHGEEEPHSPDFIGRRARGIFPGLAHMQRSFTTVPPEAINMTTEDHHHSPQPLPMDSANDISLHYAGIMKRLDQDHRRELLFKEREVTHLRQRLVEMDTIYRQELRARDFLIDDLRARLQHLEEQTEVRIEKARNSIEDIWESRWKAQSFHLWERMRRIEEESQKAIDRILAQREHTNEADDGGDEVV